MEIGTIVYSYMFSNKKIRFLENKTIFFVSFVELHMFSVCLISFYERELTKK